MFLQKIRRPYTKSAMKNEVGMTLVEALLFAALLSMLLSGFIQFALAAHWRDAVLMDDVLEEHL